MFRVEEMGRPAPNLKCALDQVSRFENALCIDGSDHDIDGVLFESFEPMEIGDRQQNSVNKEGIETLSLGPSRNIRVKTLSRSDQRRQDLERSTFHRCFQLV